MTGNFVLARAAGAGVANLTRQGLEMASGTRCDFDELGFAAETAFGGLMGAVGPMLTSGNGSAAHVGRTQFSKYMAGQTHSWRASTLAKMFAVRAADSGTFSSMVPAAAVASSGMLPSSGRGSGCQ